MQSGRGKQRYKFGVSPIGAPICSDQLTVPQEIKLLAELSGFNIIAQQKLQVGGGRVASSTETGTVVLNITLPAANADPRGGILCGALREAFLRPPGRLHEQRPRLGPRV